MPMNTTIRERRKELGLTQEQIAEYLGISTPAVSKWESGSTYPDITLLSALARLLNTDPNTLLCFQEEPSRQEITHFCNEIAQILKDKGYTKGLEESCQFMKQKIREYPLCASLLHTFALTLDGTLTLSTLTPEEKQPYEDLVLSWYQRILESEDEKLQIQSAYMLASKYIKRRNYEKAQEMIDLLPEHNVLDKQLIQADLYQQQKEHLPEAELLLQKKLLSAAMDLHGILLRLTKICMTAGQTEKAASIAEIAGHVVESLGLGTYFTYVAPLEIALAQKDAEESIRLIRELLEACQHLWKFHDSPLYDRIADTLGSGIQFSVSSTIRPVLMANLMQDPEYEFLHSHEAFQALLDQYPTD